MVIKCSGSSPSSSSCLFHHFLQQRKEKSVSSSDVETAKNRNKRIRKNIQSSYAVVALETSVMCQSKKTYKDGFQPCLYSSVHSNQFKWMELSSDSTPSLLSVGCAYLETGTEALCCSLTSEVPLMQQDVKSGGYEEGEA